jgi:hypothetical protein
MRTASVGHIERWLLASWMLVAATLPPVAVTHAHANGRGTHRHAKTTYSHVHRHPAAEERTPGTSDLVRFRGMSLDAADVHGHIFLGWVGSIACSPVTNPKDSDQQPASDDGGLALVAAPMVRPTTVGASAWGLVPQVNSEVAFVRLAHDDAGREPWATPSPPLCDRARHERSGVQLA